MKMRHSIFLLVIMIAQTARSQSEIVICENRNENNLNDELPPGYRSTTTHYYTDAVYVKKGKYYGLKRKCSDSSFILPPIYDSVFCTTHYNYEENRSNRQFFQYKCLVVKKNSHILVLDSARKDLFSGEGTYAEFASDSTLLVHNKNLKGLYSFKTGWIVPVKYTQFESLRYYAEDLGVVEPSPLIEVRLNERRGLYNIIERKEVLAPTDIVIQSKLEMNPERYTYSRMYVDEYGLMVTVDGLLLNLNLDTLADYSDIYFPVNGFRIFQVDDYSNGSYNRRYGYLDSIGRVKIRAKYNTARNFYRGIAIVQDSSDKWGIVDIAGNYLVQPTFEQMDYFFGLDDWNCYTLLYVAARKDGEQIELKDLPFKD